MVNFLARSLAPLLAVDMACWLANAMPAGSDPGDIGCLQRRQTNTQVVQTLFSGQVTGNKLGNDLYSFLGIPYAEPPTGNNRFAAPVPYEVSLFQQSVSVLT